MNRTAYYEVLGVAKNRFDGFSLIHPESSSACFVIFLADYVEERPWRPMQSPNNGRKKKVKG